MKGGISLDQSKPKAPSHGGVGASDLSADEREDLELMDITVAGGETGMVVVPIGMEDNIQNRHGGSHGRRCRAADDASVNVEDMRPVSRSCACRHLPD